ncbi:hypothetical protein FHL15_002719 [Xylaria flabelliformis]|uniref:Uncharacterized protein n=1 Tax=Xylaria flabelliformis TaxID=2512241 RepID=A0A553I8B9_9PEZI|nr:hypothetical protein FHL15_002719 [Xylaria flabelliformis]
MSLLRYNTLATRPLGIAQLEVRVDKEQLRPFIRGSSLNQHYFLQHNVTILDENGKQSTGGKPTTAKIMAAFPFFKKVMDDHVKAVRETNRSQQADVLRTPTKAKVDAVAITREERQEKRESNYAEVDENALFAALAAVHQDAAGVAFLHR